MSPLFPSPTLFRARAYKARHDALLEAAAGLSGRIDLQATASGFHTVGFLADDADEDAVVAGAREKGIIVAPLSRYCMTPIARRGLVLGFGGVAPDEIRRGIAILRPLPELGGRS